MSSLPSICLPLLLGFLNICAPITNALGLHGTLKKKKKTEQSILLDARFTVVMTTGMQHLLIKAVASVISCVEDRR